MGSKDLDLAFTPGAYASLRESYRAEHGAYPPDGATIVQSLNPATGRWTYKAMTMGPIEHEVRGALAAATGYPCSGCPGTIECVGGCKHRRVPPPRTIVVDAPGPDPIEFAVGACVRKVGGDYRFDGVVVAAFRKLSGRARYVVEDDRGVLHVFSGKQLERA